MSEIRKIYWSSFFQGLSAVASVTFTLFFLTNNITQAQIGTLFAIALISMAVLEIPTGGFADTFGHRRSVMTGLLIHSLSSLVFFIGTTFIHFAAAMLLASLGLAFISGASSSLVYDLLKRENKTDTYEKVQGRIFGLLVGAMVIAGPVGGFIFQYNIRFTMFMACIFSFIAACFIYMVEWEFRGSKPSINAYLTKLVVGMKLALLNKRLMGIVLIGIGLTTARMVFNQNMSQPFLLNIGISIFGIGVVASVIALVGALVSLQSHVLIKKIGYKYSLLLLIFIPAICLFILSQIKEVYGVAFVLFLAMIHVFREPVMVGIGQREVTDEQRSTMASTMSFIITIFVGLFFPLWGANIDVHGIRTVMIFLGVFVFVFGVTGFYLYKSAAKR